MRALRTIFKRSGIILVPTIRRVDTGRHHIVCTDILPARDRYASNELQNGLEIVEAAVKQAPNALIFASKSLQARMWRKMVYARAQLQEQQH